jgi:hypothetical protein
VLAHIKSEGGIASFVIAEIIAVQPDIGYIIGAEENEDGIFMGK